MWKAQLCERGSASTTIIIITQYKIQYTFFKARCTACVVQKTIMDKTVEVSHCILASTYTSYSCVMERNWELSDCMMATSATAPMTRIQTQVRTSSAHCRLRIRNCFILLTGTILLTGIILLTGTLHPVAWHSYYLHILTKLCRNSRCRYDVSVCSANDIVPRK